MLRSTKKWAKLIAHIRSRNPQIAATDRQILRVFNYWTRLQGKRPLDVASKWTATQQ